MRPRTKALIASLAVVTAVKLFNRVRKIRNAEVEASRQMQEDLDSHIKATYGFSQNTGFEHHE